MSTQTLTVHRELRAHDTEENVKAALREIAERKASRKGLRLGELQHEHIEGVNITHVYVVHTQSSGGA